MKKPTEASNGAMEPPLVSELLILPDGRILVHNLTRPFAGLLHALNPGGEQIASRLEPRASHPDHHELPD